MKSLSSVCSVFLFAFTLMLGFTSSLFAQDLIKIDTVLTDKVTDGVAGAPKDVFSTDTPIVYIRWKSDQVKSGQKIKSVWIADDTNNVAPANYKIDEAAFELNQSFKDKMLSSLPGSYWDGTFQMNKPTSGWPAGKYHVDIYVDDVLVKAVSFKIAAASPTVPATPAPAADAPPTAKSWGSISIDAVVGEAEPAYGVGGGDSKVEADKNAQKFCVSAGGKNCSVVISYQRCGAYAASANAAGKGLGDTQKAAETAAKADCKADDCKIVTSDCNE